MRVLIISRYFWPEDGVSEEPYILKEYVNWHLSQGHRLEVVSGIQRHHINDLKRYINLGVRFSYFFALIDRRSSFFKRIINSAILLVLASSSLIFKKKFDLIYTPSNPPLLALFISIINKLFFKKSKIIFTIQDNMIYRFKNNLLKHIFKIYMKFTVIMSNTIIVLSSPMKEEIASYFNYKKSEKFLKKIHILLNFSNLNKKYFTEKHTSSKKIDIIYAGNHGKSQDLISFLKILLQFNNKNLPNIAFYGEGTEKSKIVNFSSENNLKINFYDPVSKEEILELISRSKFGLVCMSESLSRYAFPSKLGTYLSVGTKVIICVNGYDYLNDYITEKGFGNIIDISDPKIAAEALKSFLLDSTDLDSSFYKNVNNEFNKEIYFKKLGKILEL